MRTLAILSRPDARRGIVSRLAVRAGGSALSLAALSIAALAMTPAQAHAATPSPAVTTSPHHNYCTPENIADTTRAGTSHVARGQLFKNYNGTSSNQTYIFTSTSGSSAGAGVSYSVEAQEGIIFASAKETFGGSLTYTRSITAGNQVQMSVPPREYGNAQYGAWVAHFNVHTYYETSYCTQINNKYGTAAFPENAVGWDTWDSRY